MPSPDTPSTAPQASAPPREGGWKAVVPTITVLGVFLTILIGMFAWFDFRFANAVAGFRTELAMTEKRLSDRIGEVKADLATTEKRLTDRIDGFEKRLTDRIDEVKAGLEAREAR